MSEVLLVGGQIGTPAAVVPSAPSALELEDMLYDILASGADPNLSAATLHAVQTFLHEHARSRHTHTEFLAFFARHGLPMTRETTLTISLPPIELRPQPQPAAQAFAAEPEPIEVTPVAVTRRRALSRKALWAGGCAALAAISCAVYVGVSIAQGELERVRAQERANAEALTRVQAEAASLRQTLEQNAKLVERVDQKNELLLQKLVSPLDPEQR
jgi:hypothetical protein